jgi:hypothetical protein
MLIVELISQPKTSCILRKNSDYINIFSGYSRQNGHECLDDDDILTEFLKSVVSAKIHICERHTELREEAVRYHDETGRKLISRFEFGDAHFR